jgi:DNA-binding CsgD family transcriptional regulator
MGLREFIEANSGPTTPDRLFSALMRFFSDFGAECASYHITVAHLRRLNLGEGFVFNRFPADWTQHYVAKGYFTDDPIIGLAMRHSEPFHWYDVGKLVELTNAQRAYLEDLRRFGFVDGFAFPIFAEKGTVAYIGAGSRIAPMRCDEADVLTMQYVCHYVHKRYVELCGVPGDEPSRLTRRERDVLIWLVRGKSNSAIAGILGVSENTIDTLVRRCYRKLGVSDRISAALKAVGLGLVAV